VCRYAVAPFYDPPTRTAPVVLPSSLQVSIVTFQPDLALLERTLDTLGIAVEAAQDARVLKTVHVALIDNSGDRGIAERVIELGRARFADAAVHVTFLHGHANIGYGAAHNLVLHGSGADYHLVLNPDVELAAEANTRRDLLEQLVDRRDADRREHLRAVGVGQCDRCRIAGAPELRLRRQRQRGFDERRIEDQRREAADVARRVEEVRIHGRAV